MDKNSTQTQPLKKILTLSDHPLSPSGVGIQTRNFIKALLDTGRYEIISLGAALKHAKYNMQVVEEYKGLWRILPTNNFGTQEQIRYVLHNEKPDLLWFMTDPRYFYWLWEMEHEIRPNVPMMYYHVWDNKPAPLYNKPYYDSTDKIITISKLTNEVVREIAPDVECQYHPHAVDPDIFKPLDKELLDQFSAENTFLDPNKFTIFWNNRNGRRKHPATLIEWFAAFLDKVGHDKAQLLMHTNPVDSQGTNLHAIVAKLGLTKEQIIFSSKHLNEQVLNIFYNLADVTVNISDAEGFGLGTLESLSAGTPIIVNMTGGLQEQVTDGENYFGVGIQPSSQMLIGSLPTPYVYEDRINKNDFLDALEKLMNMTPEERTALGMAGQQHVYKNYNYENYKTKWVDIVDEFIERKGSWKDRKDHIHWSIKEF